uniref:Tyrosine--tRNA ligase n=1 Tax=Dunaliella tertiolecta TaxID=3047 RepID=A0A7S3R7S5_DUNTE|mmetsp:Transcript_1977/g.5014  ORF Transcript_1977/g.5014 Transcript_1977/m.5014 type:complete len:524 (-) Transcript_1977:282-1853(-)
MKMLGHPSMLPGSSLAQKRALCQQPGWQQATCFRARTFARVSKGAAFASVAPTDAPANASTAPLPNVVRTLRERGLVQDVTSEQLEQLTVSQSVPVYCGFDPTADSLHLGNLLGIIVLSWFQRCGHQPVALLGGATGRVGDPSGRSSERPILTEEKIEGNVKAIGQLLDDILRRNSQQGASSSSSSSSSQDGPPLRDVKVVNNLDWFGPMSFLAFLREVGKFARVGTMLSKDSVRTRMESESGISFTEFTYQLLQGYDFVHLCREHGVRVQIGGSDQWGNIIAGTDLARRLLGREGEGEVEEGSQEASSSGTQTCYGLTFPLLVDSEGRKFGKSVDGAIWLSAEKLSPYKFYQHLFNVTDADVVKFLKMLTFMPLPEIEALAASMSKPDYVPNTAQRRLAEEVTRFVHGEAGLQQALKTTEALKPGSATQLDVATLEAVAGDAPSASLGRDAVAGATIADVMVAAKMQPSKGAARKLIKGGGVYMNNQKVTEEMAKVEDKDLVDGRMLLLAAGKKNKMLIRVE